MAILVTGGAGYIGSHTCVELLRAGLDLVVVDNLSNSKPEVLKRIREIAGRDFEFYKLDILDEDRLSHVFARHEIEAVVHFAGLKAVGESVQVPLKYYHNNVTGSLVLAETMVKFGVKKLVFSSSATVYGNPAKVPIEENFPLNPSNPYGRSKLMVEEVLRDLYASDNLWSIALLRYFNPIGAHHSGRIGEDPNGIPNNLMPFITQVAVGKRKKLQVFGNDYNTHDGTGVRDYIHVVDLALGHVQALRALNGAPGVGVYNLGTGIGYSVLDVIGAFEKVTGVKIPYEVANRRPGDIDKCFASPGLALDMLGWRADKGIAEMCRDAWNWQRNNPEGY